MEHVHTAHHGWLVHEWQVVNRPGNTTDLCVDLNEDLVDDRPQVLALRDGIAQHDLGWNGELSQEESLNVIVKWILPLLTRHEEDDSLHIRVKLGLELFGPVD